MAQSKKARKKEFISQTLHKIIKTSSIINSSNNGANSSLNNSARI